MSKEEKTMLLNFENIFVMIYFSSDPGQIIVYPCQLLTDSVMMLRFDWCDPGWLWCEENMLFKGIVIMKLKFCDFRNIFPDFECPKNILVPENKKRQKFSRFHVKRKTVFFPMGKQFLDTELLYCTMSTSCNISIDIGWQCFTQLMVVFVFKVFYLTPTSKSKIFVITWAGLIDMLAESKW